MKKLFTLFLFLIILSFACTKDETPTPDPGNANSNAAITARNHVEMVSEDPRLTTEEAAMRLEMPALRGGDNNLLVVHSAQGYGINYAMEYDTQLKAGRWSAYRTCKGFSCNENHWNRKNWADACWDGEFWGADPFREDKLIPRKYRTTLQDHKDNGYDRGHIIGSADRLNTMETNGQTFYLSNMHPQLPGFNQRGIWKSLEEHIRKAWDKDDFRDTLYIVKGGVIDRNVTYAEGRGNPLLVPGHFFMALLCKDSGPAQWGYKAIAFWMKHEENNSRDFKAYAVSIDELERLTGIDFFCNLPDEIENTVEENLNLRAWGIR